MFLKSEILKAITLKKNNNLSISYWLLVCLRFVLTVLPQIGYIHPDEYFQNIEIIAGDIFPIDVSRTWEFDPKFPIRNIFVPKLVFGPPLYLIRFANPYTKYYLNINLRTPYFLLVIPRLFICLLSLINDYCLYKICVLYGQNVRNRMKIFASSYVILVYCCRGFSNSFEMVFFSILLFLVAECMSKSDKIIYHDEFLREKYNKAQTPVERVKLFKLKTHLPAHSFSRVATIATVTVIGIFNRPTFVGFAFPPLFFWLHRGLGSKVVGFKDFHFRIFALILCGIPTVMLMIVIDSGYYGYLTMAEIEWFKISLDNWVVTPLNFLKYNSDTKNLTPHGLHPRWLHLVVNVPLLFNVLGGIAAIAISIIVYRFLRGQYSKLPRIQSITGLMLFSLVIPIGVLSMFPHQEARFIIPSLVPLVYLYGNHLFANDGDGRWVRRAKRLLLYTWYALNVALTIFYGFVHQGGIYPFTDDLHYETKSHRGVHTHVITAHSYSLPTFLLQTDSTSRVWRDRAGGRKYALAPQTFLYKYGSLPADGVMRNVDDVLSGAERLLHEARKEYRFYVASPCSRDAGLRAAARRYRHLELLEERAYYPHFCTEAFPGFPGPRDPHCARDRSRDHSRGGDLGVVERVSCFLNRFCLKIYRVEVSHREKFGRR